MLDRFGRAVAKRADVVVGVNPDWTINVPCQPRRFIYIPNIVADRFYELEARPEPGVVLFPRRRKVDQGMAAALRSVASRPHELRRRAAARARLVGLAPPELPHDLGIR